MYTESLEGDGFIFVLIAAKNTFKKQAQRHIYSIK